MLVHSRQKHLITVSNCVEIITTVCFCLTILTAYVRQKHAIAIFENNYYSLSLHNQQLLLLHDM